MISTNGITSASQHHNELFVCLSLEKGFGNLGCQLLCHELKTAIVHVWLTYPTLIPLLLSNYSSDRTKWRVAASAPAFPVITTSTLFVCYDNRCGMNMAGIGCQIGSLHSVFANEEEVGLSMRK